MKIVSPHFANFWFIKKPTPLLGNNTSLRRLRSFKTELCPTNPPDGLYWTGPKINILMLNNGIVHFVDILEKIDYIF